MTSDSRYDSIRPYTGKEIEEASNRLSTSKDFLDLFSKLLEWDRSTLIERLQGITTLDLFQDKFFMPVVERLIDKTTAGVSFSGLEHLEREKSYLFISNHRDIILDSAILNNLLKRNGRHYCQAAIGSNLLINEWVTDLVRLNSCFIIERGVTGKEMVISAALRSGYIRDLIEEMNYSVWIAQREGRTKNGDDKTQNSLLKMFKMSGPKDFVENFRELNIVPVSISYEWEPCDYLKTDELYRRNLEEYVKTPEADMMGMYKGLADYKGRVNFAIGKPLREELVEFSNYPNNGDRIAALAKHIDMIIHKQFKLWPNNYIAYDISHGSTKFISQYREEEREKFIETMQQKLDNLPGDRSILKNIYIDIYANTVKNSIRNNNL